MPSKSQEQQRLMGMALHNPKKIYKRNRGVLKMSKKQLRDYATTPSKTLPQRAKGYAEGGQVKRETTAGAGAGMLNDSRDWGRFRSATPPPTPPRAAATPPKPDALEWARKQTPYRWRPEADINEFKKYEATRGRVARMPENLKMPEYKPWAKAREIIPKNWSAGENVKPFVKAGGRALGRVLGTAGAVASDLVFPRTAGLTPKEESAAIKARGYKGFCKGGRVKR